MLPTAVVEFNGMRREWRGVSVADVGFHETTKLTENTLNHHLTQGSLSASERVT